MTLARNTLFNLLCMTTLLFQCSSCTSSLLVEDSPQDVFQMFWDQMDRHYTNFAEHPINWDSIYSHYFPMVERMVCDSELVPVFSAIIQDIADAHISISHSSGINIHHRCPDTHTDHQGDIFARDTTLYYCTINQDYSHSEEHYFWSFDIIHHSAEESRRIAYLAISSFRNPDTESLYKEELLRMIQRKPDGCIIDLRNNGGGFLICAIELVRQFYSGERILLNTCSRASVEDHWTMTPPEPIVRQGENTVPETIPIVVLINSGTYSAANICTYMFGTLPNITIVGLTSTYGGGSSPSCVELPHNWSMSFPNNLKHFVNGQSCEYPYLTYVQADTLDRLEETIDIGGREYHFFVGAPIVTAVRIIEDHR